jgi:hypothetical protein
VKDGFLELDVVVEAHLRAPKARALHLGLELGQLGWTEPRDGCVELGVLTSHALHALERELGQTRRRIDAQRFGEQALPFGVVVTMSGPRGKQPDALVGPVLFDQPLRDAQCRCSLAGGFRGHTL